MNFIVRTKHIGRQLNEKLSAFDFYTANLCEIASFGMDYRPGGPLPYMS